MHRPTWIVVWCPICPYLNLNIFGSPLPPYMAYIPLYYYTPKC